MSDSVHTALCTCPDPDTAERLASALVDEGLAACVNLIPGILSVYRWQGQVHRDPEVLMLIKTTGERLAALATRIRELHPYELPELIVQPVSAGLPDYLEWIRACTNPQQDA